jgi:hypothetical protein
MSGQCKAKITFEDDLDQGYTITFRCILPAKHGGCHEALGDANWNDTKSSIPYMLKWSRKRRYNVLRP